MFSRAQRGVIELQSFSGKSETVLKGGMRKGEGEGKDENSSQEFILKGRGRDGGVGEGGGIVRTVETMVETDAGKFRFE